jgi:hypothetical protein
MTEIVQVSLSTVTKDHETVYRARGLGFQGLAVVAPTMAEAKADALEVIRALRAVRGQGEPYDVVFLDG